MLPHNPGEPAKGEAQWQATTLYLIGHLNLMTPVLTFNSILLASASLMLRDHLGNKDTQLRSNPEDTE